MAEDSDALLSVQGVTVRFAKLLALRDVGLGIGRHDLLGLVGPNGSGKTTLMRAIAGLQPISSGAITFGGLTTLDGPGAARCRSRIGFTPDVPPVYLKMRVRDFLVFVGKGYGLGGAEIRERIDMWLDRLWLKDKAKQRIATLSRGMKQRVGLARTLLPDPDLIMLDEPASGLDPAGRVEFRECLITLRDAGKTMIVSSHILADLNEYCTHIGIMSKGRMVRFGTVDEVSGIAHATRCRYDVTMAVPVADHDVRAALPEKSTAYISTDQQTMSVEYDIGRTAAAELLASLVKRGLPVAGFAAQAVNLEEAYMRSFQADAAPAAPTGKELTMESG